RRGSAATARQREHGDSDRGGNHADECGRQHGTTPKGWRLDSLRSAERRELGPEPLGGDLRDALRPVDVLESEEPEIAQEHMRWEVVLDELARGRREQDLA